MRSYFLTAVAILGMFPLASGQRSCGSATYLQQQRGTDLGEKMFSKAENQINNWIREHGNEHRAGNVITIPVVVHVVYRNAAQNISQAQIQSQIDVLNEDYRKLNADVGNVPAAWQGITADAEIQFCLAQRDPNGLPTDGIVRVSTTDNGFSLDDQVKFTSQGGDDAWPSSSYLNIWTCSLTGGILGYAQFPGQPAATDGVVIGYNYFGRTGVVQAPFNKGRTTTHEVGHWLGLFHIWGDDNNCTGSDQVADTPNQQTETYGCPSGVQTDACSPSAPGIMWMNYMDYTDDACMYMFTEGQKTRMRSVLNNQRASLANSLGCVPVALQANDAGISAISAPSGSSCASDITPVVTLFNYGSGTLTGVTINWQVDSGTPGSYTWSGNLASLTGTTVTLPSIAVAVGAHNITIWTTNPNSQTDGNTANDSQTSAFTVTAAQTSQPSPYAYGFEPGAFPPAGWTLLNPDQASTWERSGSVGFSSSASAWINNYDYNANNEEDILELPPVNLSSVASPTLTFDVAYALYSQTGFSDTLTVHASSDCGATWTEIYRKAGQQLTTVTPYYQATAFTPTANQWRNESISMNNFGGQSGVILRFRNVTQYENNLYLDNINLGGVVSADPNMLSQAMTVYPNPSQDRFNVSVKLAESMPLNVSVVNQVGQKIFETSRLEAKDHQFNIDLSNLPTGVYFLKASSGNAQVTRKLVRY